jgi:thiosulfate/3-mercaptopyruvate sulfurtransferase
VLDGGLPRWECEGLPTESGPVVEITRTKYPAPALLSENVRSESPRAGPPSVVAQPSQDYEQMVSNTAKELSDPLAEVVLDARAHGRYEPDCVTSDENPI